MKTLKQVYFRNRNEFRQWLGSNHDKSPGIWMEFFKKHLEISCINYTEALEEAICFGWIDSIIKKIDEEKYVRKFTPRKDTGNWSEINKKIVNKLIDRGIMTRAGLEKIDSYIKTGNVNWTDESAEKRELKKQSRKNELPDFIIDELSKNEPALMNFNKLPPSHRKHYVFWITGASREETIQKRLREAIGLLKENNKLGLK
jgi:uncharacterized protein YdeI (YjbR/CyaY-like superfamily)